MSTTPTETSRPPALPDSATAVLAFIAWSGVLLQLVLSLQLAVRSGQSVADGLVTYLGYFTVLTNLLAAFALSAVLRQRDGHAAAGTRAGLAHPQVLAGVAANIALVGLSYHVLLRNIWNPQGAQWVADVLLHYVTPWLFVLWWLLKAPWPAMRWWWPLVWALYPTLYLGYALLLGGWLGRYAYPFIDVLALGYGRVMVNAFALLGVFLVISAVLVGLKHLWLRRRP